MEKALYNRKGQPVAYIAADYFGTIYLWAGEPVAYLYEEIHVYGITGQHLGWFKDEVLYTPEGARVGFTPSTCPVPIAKSPQKGRKAQISELKPRWKPPPSPEFSYQLASQDLADFLKQGEVRSLRDDRTKESAQD